MVVPVHRIQLKQVNTSSARAASQGAPLQTVAVDKPFASAIKPEKVKTMFKNSIMRWACGCAAIRVSAILLRGCLLYGY